MSSNNLHQEFPFDGAILSNHSQYTYGGELSCTYICLSAVEYFLNNYSKFRIPISSIHSQDKITTNDIDYVLQLGVSRDRKVGLTSCDDVYSNSEYFQKTLELKSMHISKLSDNLSFKQLLKTMESKSIDSKSSSDVTALVLTKPPETIAIFYDCYGYVNGKEKEYYPWFIFDSHPRKHSRGGGFYLFKDLSKIEDYLKKLFIDDFDYYRNMFDSYQAKSHVMFEGTIVTLKNSIIANNAKSNTTTTSNTSTTNNNNNNNTTTTSNNNNTSNTTTTTSNNNTTTTSNNKIANSTNTSISDTVVSSNTTTTTTNSSTTSSGNNDTHESLPNIPQNNEKSTNVQQQTNQPTSTQLIEQLMKKIDSLTQTNKQQFEEIQTLQYLLKEEQDNHKITLLENQQLKKTIKNL